MQQNEKNDVIFQWSSPPNMNSSEVCIKSTSQRKEAPMIMSGWLFKMRRKKSFYTPTWDLRWVAIQNDSISWRHTKSSEVAGSISLSEVESIYKVKAVKQPKGKTTEKKGGGQSKDDDFDRVFVIRSKKRALCLMTKKEEQCDKWVRAIQLQLDLRSGGTFSGPAGDKNRRKSNGGGDKYEASIRTSPTFTIDTFAFTVNKDPQQCRIYISHQLMIKTLNQSLVYLSNCGTDPVKANHSQPSSDGTKKTYQRDFLDEIGLMKGMRKKRPSMNTKNKLFESSRFHFDNNMRSKRGSDCMNELLQIPQEEEEDEMIFV